MLITEIYTKYQVPQNLQEHMLRVAALGKIISEKWIGKVINQNALIEASMLHDIAKPMTFDLIKQSGFGMTAVEIEKLKQWQIELKTKYGETEHAAMINICREIGCRESSIRIADELEWFYLPRLLKQVDYEAVMAVYDDMRIGPRGLLPLVTRFDELRSRAKIDNFDQLIKAGTAAEAMIQKDCRMDLTTITDNDLINLFDELSLVEIG
jgi:hypothetical protein